MRVPAEAFFDFKKAENWHLHIGQIPPAAGFHTLHVVLARRRLIAREGLEHERWSRCQQDAICLRQGEVAVIALNRSYLDGKCWLERQKVLRNGADTAQAEYQLRADSNLLDEIQKRSDLRRREVARGMIGIERIEFFRPFRQDLNKLASRQ